MSQVKCDTVPNMSIVKARNTFAIDFYRKLIKENGGRNVFYSPYSVSEAMSMLLLGSAGKSETELVRVLELEGVSNVQTEIGKLRASITEPVDGVELSTANSLFPEQSYKILEGFIDKTKEYYGAVVTQLDFKDSAEQSRKTINDWVLENTKNKIENLMPDGSITADTRLVLANAIYFKGNWDTQFDKSKTVDHDFHITPQKVTKVKMMNRKAKYNFTMDKKLNAAMLEIPYKGNSTSMIIVLPVDKFELDSVEKNINMESIQNMESFFKQEVVLGLPQFKMEFGSDLMKSFEALGASSIFGSKADFSKISGSKDLFVSAIAHKAFVEVNEEGTEAAAATGIAMSRMSMPLPPTQFICDHPFMFFIKHKPTNIILFAGRYINPE